MTIHCLWVRHRTARIPIIGERDTQWIEKYGNKNSIWWNCASARCHNIFFLYCCCCCCCVWNFQNDFSWHCSGKWPCLDAVYSLDCKWHSACSFSFNSHFFFVYFFFSYFVPHDLLNNNKYLVIHELCIWQILCGPTIEKNISFSVFLY